MRIGGVQLKGLNEAILVLTRPDGDIVFKARAIPDYDDFNKLCPEPIAPAVLTREGKKTDETDRDYLAQLAQREVLRIAYIMVKSLEPSEIEWDTVKMEVPQTWVNYKDDFKKAGISAIELNRIWALVSDANSLSEDKLEAARARFLRGQAQASSQSSSPSGEPGNTPSGELASASA